MSRKRPREQPTVNVQLVEIYEDLASVDEQVRLKAAHTLLTRFVTDGAATKSQLVEILRRLCRGLCSGRKTARLGFSIALTELLSKIFNSEGKETLDYITIPDLIEIWRDQTETKNEISGQVHSSCTGIPERMLMRCTVGKARSPSWTSFWCGVDYQIGYNITANLWHPMLERFHRNYLWIS